MLIDIMPTAMLWQFHFINCTHFTQNYILCIKEFLDLPQTGCSMILYMWHGKSPLAGAKDGRLRVKDAGNLIGMEVLNHACTASLKRGFPYIWMDQLCIIQSSEEDKNWQISQMFWVYWSSSLCVVLMGGMQHLVPLNKEMTWIHWGWTLQEVLAPSLVLVLF